MASETKKRFEQYRENEGLRQEAKQLFNQAMSKEKYDLAKRYLEFIENDMAYEYQELPFNSQYVNLLKENYEGEKGKPFEGDIRELIEKDFGNWNFVESNLTFGAGKETLDYYTNKSDEEKENALQRYETFSKISPWGSGSRDFIKFTGDDAWDFLNPSHWTGQAPDVIKGMATDPFTYLTGGLAALMSKNMVKKGESKELAPRLATSTTSAGYTAAADAERQVMKQAMGSDEEFSPSQTMTSAAIGFVAPRVLEPFGTVTGKMMRGVTHPGQTIGTITKTLASSKGKEAAQRGVAQEVAEQLAKHGDDFSSSSLKLHESIKGIFNSVEQTFKSRYEKLKAAPIKTESILGFYNKWLDVSQIVRNGQKLPGLPIPSSVDRVIAKLEAGQITPIIAAREIREAINLARGDAVKSKNGYAKSDVPQLKQFHKTLTNIINKATKKASREDTTKLDKQYSAFKSIPSGKYGKLLFQASQDQEAAGRLVQSMLKKDFNWNAWNTTINHIKKLEATTGLPQGSSNVIKMIQATVSPALMSNDGRLLAQMVKTKTGLNTLKGMFPNLSKQWDNIAEVSKKLGNFESSASVVANMSIARLGGYAGASLGGDVAGQSVGAVGGLSLFNRLMDSKFFRSAMVHAYKRQGGRLTTATRNWMRKQGLSIKEINIVQDTMWGMTATGFAIKGEDMLSDTGNMARDKLNNLKAGFNFGD